MSTDNNIRSLSRHEEYYIPSADLFILVEQVQFRVHRYFFERESKWFGGKLEFPASPGAKLVGSDDSTAIILDELSPESFAKFLWVFYNKTYSLYEAPVEDWEIILTLSNRWTFPGVKELAIRELEKKTMSDVKRIKLYKENQVDRNYLIPRYAALCEREQPLTAEEGMDLGMTDVIQIAAAREQARSSFLPSGARSPLSPTIHGTDLYQVIREVFHIAPLETGFTANETTNITGALTTQPTRQPTPKTQPAQKQKQGTKKQTKQTGTGPGTAPPPTTATPQKLAATPTPTTTQVVPPPQPSKETTPQTNPTPAPPPEPPAKEGEEPTTTTAPTTKNPGVGDDVAGQQQKAEVVSRTGVIGDASFPDSGLTELDLLISTASNADNTAAHVPAVDTTLLDFTDLEDTPASVTSSPSSFSFNTYSFGQQSSSRPSVFGGVSSAFDNLR